MILRRRVAPALTAVLGIVGFIVRKLELKTVFDPKTGLCDRWNILSFITLLLAVAAAAFAIYISIRMTRECTDKSPSISFSWGNPELIFGIIAAAFIIVGTILAYNQLWYSTFKVRWLERLFLILCAVGGVCFAVLSMLGGGSGRGTVSRIASALIPLWLCIWMLYFYRLNAENPVLNAFIWECFGIMAASVGTFGFAGYVYGTFGTRYAPAAILIGEYLCIISIADQTERNGILLLIGLTLWLFVLASCMIGKDYTSKH